MQNALFVGVSAQTALARELDVIANNMANVSTTGFKGRSARFQEYLMPVASADSFQRQDRRVSYVIDQGTPLDLSQGPVEPDGNPMHVAVRGDAFLAVQTPRACATPATARSNSTPEATSSTPTATPSRATAARSPSARRRRG